MIKVKEFQLEMDYSLSFYKSVTKSVRTFQLFFWKFGMTELFVLLKGNVRVNSYVCKKIAAIRRYIT